MKGRFRMSRTRQSKPRNPAVYEDRLLLVSGVVAAITFMVFIFDRSTIASHFSTLFSGIFMTQLLTKKYKVLCKQNVRLCETGHLPICGTGCATGIVKAYPKRRGVGDDAETYRNDLLREFQNLHPKHVSPDKGEAQEPIKIIGVALESYFGDPEESILSAQIANCCKNVPFNVLICDPSNNKELEYRHQSLKQGGMQICEMKETRLVRNIVSSISRIEELQVYRKLCFHKYVFAPYATIIFVNDRVFYTPNMTLFEDEIGNGAEKNELTLCLARDSKAGVKLADLFKEQWDDVNVPNAQS